MEFYKLVGPREHCRLEEEQGQAGMALDRRALAELAQLLGDCRRQQARLPLQLRRYLTAYHQSGDMAYVALADAASLAGGPSLDGFAVTLLEGEEENRLWFGADGVVENRGPSGEKVREVLELLLQSFRRGETEIPAARG